jgi:S1-C subfamily serine protease
LNGDLNQGDSGAPVINANGKVICIAQARDANRNGQAMAIPISLLFKIFQPDSDALRSAPIQVPTLTEGFVVPPNKE